MGMGYKNIVPRDSYIHSMSALGIKVLPLQRVSYGKKSTSKSKREYKIQHYGSPVGTIKEWKEFAKKQGVKRIHVNETDGDDYYVDLKAKFKDVRTEPFDEVSTKDVKMIEKEIDTKIISLDRSDEMGASNNIFVFDTKNDEEWMLALSEDDAETMAEEQVREDLEDQPEIFDQDWLLGQIDEGKAEDFFTSVYDEWNWSYVNDIESESDNEYPNRLRGEMVNRDLITEKQAQDEEFDIETFKDDFVDEMTKDQIDEGTGGYTHYESNFGEAEAKKLILDNNLIDLDEATENAIAVDGWQHFIARYDGKSIDLPNGMVIWREN